MTPEQLVVRYQHAYNTTRMEAARRVEALWQRFGGLTEAEAARFVSAAVPVATGAQRAVAALVVGYLDEMTRQVTGRRSNSRINMAEVVAARGVPAVEVYQRPVVEARTAISQGKAWSEAMRLAGQRAGVLAQTDVALAQRAATVQTLDRQVGVVGYRRTLTGDSCALCATASTQRYRIGQLAPIHARCDCGISPIYGTNDPGRVINDRLLADLKQQGGPKEQHGLGVDEQGVIRRRREVPVVGSDGKPERLPNGRVRRRSELGEPLQVATREHGELGPVLTDAADHFTSAADLNLN